MFGDDSTNKEFLLNGLNIAIIDKKIVEHELCNSLIKKLKDDSSSVNISTLSTVDELYKEISQNICDTSNCLLNMQWIDLVYNIRPSVMILFYYIVDVNLKDEEENNLSKIIDNIRSSDQNLPIYLFIIIPVQEYDKYQHLKGDEKNFNILKRKMNKENFFIYSSKDVIKNNDLKKLNENIISNSRNYYRQTKNLLKNKIKNAKYKEEQIKYLIMTAILSIVKTKRKYPCCSKHLNKAYYLILAPNFNFKEYYYGNSDNSVQNFYEIRSIADWLLFKILILNNKRNEETNITNKKKPKIIEKGTNLDILSKIDIFINHIKTFSSYEDEEIKDPSFTFYNYFWTYKRLLNLSEFFDKYFNELKEEQKYLLKLSQIKFYILYNFIKLMKFYQKYYLNLDLEKININNKEIPLSSISSIKNSFYGKPPEYIYTPENSEKKIKIGYNDDIFLKLTITKNNLTLDNLDKTLKDELIKNILSFYCREAILHKGFEISNFDISNEIEMIGIKIYLNILRFYTNYPNCKGKDEKNLDQYKDEKDINIELYKLFERASNIKKFPKIYKSFLEKNSEYLIYQMKNFKEKEKFDNTKKTILFKSLSILSSIKLLTEEEQDIFNQLLNDKDFIPIPFEKEKKNPSVSLEINDFFVVGETETEEKEKQQKNVKTKEKVEEEQEKNCINKYIKENDFLISLYNTNKIYYNNKEDKIGILFEYNIKNIDISQNRKILDLVEYEFKISTKLEKLRLKFDNIKIFFSYINKNNKENKSEILMKEYTGEYLSNLELTTETPIKLEHKIFLKYREGKIKVTKILATLLQKKDIIYSIDLPNDIQKVIFIKDVTTNVLNFDYQKNFKVGKNQYNPFELKISKEKNDEVEIKDLKIELETLPTFAIKDFSSDLNLGKKKPIKHKDNKGETIKSPILTSVMATKIGNNQFKHTISSALGINIKESPCEKRSSAEVDSKYNKYNSYIPNNINHMNKLRNLNNIEEKNLKSAIMGNKEFKSNKKQYIPPEFYIYNNKENILNKYNEKMEILYKDFESLLNKGENKYTTLIRFLNEGSYKIKFSVIYFIRHKKIEDYIEYREESILDFNVINPFLVDTNASANNYCIQNKNNPEKKEKESLRFYLTNCKINMNFILNNKIEANIKIKDIEIIYNNEKGSIKYINSYISDLIHSYDLSEEEKNDMLIIKKNSSYTFPFETEFSQPFKGSIGKLNIIWSTDALDNFEKGKLNILNKEEYEFPEIDVKPLEFEYKYETQINDNNEISLGLTIKNVSMKLKQIIVYVLNNNDGCDKEFIIIGIDKQSHLIGVNEEIKFNYTLIPVGRGEFFYPYFQISEYYLHKSERKNINYYYSENIAII